MNTVVIIFVISFIVFSSILNWAPGTALFNDQSIIYRYYLKEFWFRSFDFQGRTNRKYFWLGLFIWVFFSFLFSIFGYFLYMEFNNSAFIFGVNTFYSIASIIPTLSIQIRRLNDIGKDPRNILLTLIPIFGSLILFFWFTYPSKSCEKVGSRNQLTDLENKLEELKSLLDREIISDDEYKSMRKKTLGL